MLFIIREDLFKCRLELIHINRSGKQFLYYHLKTGAIISLLLIHLHDLVEVCHAAKLH
jgi:hypothetical protein